MRPLIEESAPLLVGGLMTWLHAHVVPLKFLIQAPAAISPNANDLGIPLLHGDSGRHDVQIRRALTC
jgi:hypothetical protein